MTKYYLKTNCILLNFANDMAFTDKFEKDEYYLTPEGYIVFTEKYHLKRDIVVKAVAVTVHGIIMRRKQTRIINKSYRPA